MAFAGAVAARSFGGMKTLATLLIALAVPICAPAAAGAESRIVYAAEGRLVSVPAGGGAPRTLARIPHSTVGVSAAAGGRLFAMVANRELPASRQGSVRTYYVLRLGHGLRRVSRLHLRASVAMSFSPDGRLIAFCRGGEIWTLDVGSGRPRQATRGPGGAFDPTFAADSRHLVFIRHAPGRPSALVRGSIAGGVETTLATGEVHDPAVSADERVAFLRSPESAPGRIVVTNMDGSGRRTLVKAREPVFNSDPVFSPSGDAVAYRSLYERNGSATSYRYSIHTVPVDGGPRRKVVGGLRSTADEPLTKGRGPLGPLWTR